MDRKLWEILVPRQRNNGRPYRTRHHRAWDKQVIKISGGLTVLRPTTAGYWKNEEGDMFADSTIPVRIYCSEDQINDILMRTLIHYDDQEAVMAYAVSDHVKVVTRK